MLPLSALAFVLCIVTLLLGRRWKRKSLAHIPGPKPESFLLGNLPQLLQSQVGEYTFKWLEEFGGIVRIKGTLGEDKLLISDPKALQYILKTSGYGVPRQRDQYAMIRLITGRGLDWADGAIHQRQKRVMLPAFGVPEMRSFLPVLRGIAQQITARWQEQITQREEQFSVIDVSSWFARATLDAIGEAAFDYRFGAMEQSENTLAQSFENMFSSLFGTPTAFMIFTQNLLQYLPLAVVDFMVDYAPGAQFESARKNEQVAIEVAKQLVKEKAKASLEGKGKKDIFSILVRANLGMDPRLRLNDEELYAQMRTMLVSAHDTTAVTLCWALFEMAQHRDIQTKLRDEIRATQGAVHARGDADWTIKDYDSMIYFSAFFKEVLRVHPIAYHLPREAGKDDVFPLSEPIVTKKGDILTEVLVPKGTKLVVSVAGYNRNKAIWGEDAHVFRPERWLDGTLDKRENSVPMDGLYAKDLLTFSTGVRGCIGWRLAIMELQTFLVELVGNFQFELAVPAERIRREACMIMVPTVEGEIEKGMQMPLRVSLASRSD